MKLQRGFLSSRRVSAAAIVLLAFAMAGTALLMAHERTYSGAEFARLQYAELMQAEVVEYLSEAEWRVRALAGMRAIADRSNGQPRGEFSAQAQVVRDSESIQVLFRMSFAGEVSAAEPASAAATVRAHRGDAEGESARTRARRTALLDGPSWMACAQDDPWGPHVAVYAAVNPGEPESDLIGGVIALESLFTKALGLHSGMALRAEVYDAKGRRVWTSMKGSPEEWFEVPLARGALRWLARVDSRAFDRPLPLGILEAGLAGLLALLLAVLLGTALVISRQAAELEARQQALTAEQARREALAAEREALLAEIAARRTAESEDRFRSLVEEMNEVLFIAGASETRLRYVSPRSLTLLLYSPSELIAMPDPLVNLVPEEDREQVRTRLAAAVARRESTEVEHRLVRQDGRVLWVRDHWFFPRDTTMAPGVVYGILQDITARKEAEEVRLRHYRQEARRHARILALHDLGEALREAGTEAEIGAALARLAARATDGRIAGVTRAQPGGELEEIATHGVAEPRHPRPCTDRINRLVARTGSSHVTAHYDEYPNEGEAGPPPEMRGIQGFACVALEGRRGVLGTLFVGWTPAERPNPEIVALLEAQASLAALAVERLAAFREVEERARALAGEVHEQRDFLHSILEEMADGVFTVDKEARILSWNPAAGRITSVPPAQALGRACWEVLCGNGTEGAAPAACATCPLYPGKPTVDREQRFECRLGAGAEAKTLGLDVSPISGVHSNGAARAIVVFRDISREKELVDSLLAADQTRARFVSTMSHELRNPLNGLLGLADLLREPAIGPLNPKQTSYVQSISTVGRHLASLINDLLDLSRLDAGRLRLDAEPVAPESAVPEIATSLQALGLKKGLTVAFEIAEGLPRVAADRQRLRQVLYNLLSNAIKFTPTGGTITVGARAVRPARPRYPRLDGAPGDWVELWVRDTGVGIAHADQGRLFEPFSQVGAGASGKYEGTGLGLSISRRLVELHGGEIYVESEPERGAEFGFLLPAVAQGGNGNGHGSV